MHNPFRLPLLMLNSRRPSRIGEMPTVRDGLWLRKGYDALTFFGHIVVATDEMVEEMKEKASPLRNHEMIHLRQAQSTHDSWFFFYLLDILKKLIDGLQNSRIPDSVPKPLETNNSD